MTLAMNDGMFFRATIVESQTHGGVRPPQLRKHPIPMASALSFSRLRIIFMMACLLSWTFTAAHGEGDEESTAPTILRIDGISTDPTYGFTPDNPIKLGGIPSRDMDFRIQSYFSRVITPEGLPIQWEPMRPCCPFHTPHGVGEEGMLEVYYITLPGQRRTRFFVDHYEEGTVLTPVGTLFYRTAEEAAAIQNGQQALNLDRVDMADGILRPLADAGSPVARYTMGMIQMSRNKAPEALPWFIKAGEQGHGPSQRMAGLILLKAAKTGNNAEKGLEWLEQAANNRDGEARWRLARERFQGRHGLKDPTSAVLWARLAAEQGQVAAQLDLGTALLKGEGTAKNPSEALGWFALAKLNGHPEARELFDRVSTQVPTAMTIAANQFAQGWSTQELPSEVVSRLWSKAEHGDPDAQIKLAVALYNGVMVNRSVESALFYALLSSEVGTPGAATLAELIAKDIPPETLQQIRHRINAWKPS